MWKVDRTLFLLICCVVVVFSADCSVSDVGIYELKVGSFSVKLTNWGAGIVSVVLPDKDGKLDDIVLGYDSLDDYKNDKTYFGAIVGRVANRIGGAKFTLNGTLYKLAANDGKNTLHGGVKGFSDVLWKVSKHQKTGSSPHITFFYQSYDGEEGFPGGLIVTVTYTITGHNLLVKMVAKATNKPTPVNLAQHTYWNLAGHNSGNILNNQVQIFGSKITEVDKDLIPTGKILPVKNTPYDLLKPTVISSKIKELGKGYDINYCIDNFDSSRKMKTAAFVHDKKSGRRMEVVTDQPGVQFYTGNYIKDVKGKGGFVYQEHAGLCLETQNYPDAVNHPNFPSEIVVPGKQYKHLMLFKFSIQA
ncbi:galactose mutarotase-like [Impatiens glandulifera]|uniref:galactose mutarotase-like n=1 Tax=Impatiens glandulifera TaxID=253017 RepID=UPI001FB0759F|nr:galactose mutarotase-like [Impatiens glandulifera]